MIRNPTYQSGHMSVRKSILTSAATILVVLASSNPISVQAQSAERADLNNDGVVNSLDFRLLAVRLGKQSGEAGYLEGMDIVPDGIIDANDLLEMKNSFRQAADNSSINTQFSGHVFDALGNPLPGVKVFLGSGIALNDLLTGACVAPTCQVSDATGLYRLTNLPQSVYGETEVSFVANAVSDPTPNVLSGQYPTIPHKPVFIIAGDENMFRDVPLPELDLTGAKSLGAGGDVDAIQNPDGSFTVNEIVEIDNGGTMVQIPLGCNIDFPDGGLSTQLSVTQVPPSQLPVAMPPGLSSSLFVTFQPGETQLDCAGQTFITEFDNVDGFPITRADTDPNFIPRLNGIVAGVFEEFARCDVIDLDGNGVDGDVNDIVRCPVNTPFSFAWYHTDITPPQPCPLTTVIGQVKTQQGNIPIQGAVVTVPGATPAITDSGGNFSIPRVSSGPNGVFCFTRPFNVRVTATGTVVPSGVSDSSVSTAVAAVPGGITDVGMVFLGNENGQVLGRVLKLSRIQPELVVPLEGAQIVLFDSLETQHNGTTDSNGNYGIDDVEIGPYTKTMTFSGDIPLPGGGIVTKDFTESQSGNVNLANIPDVNNFLLTSFGAVNVTVIDENGNPVPNAFVQLSSLGGNVGMFSIEPATFSDISNTDGKVSFPADFSGPQDAEVPIGPCQIDVSGFGVFGSSGPDDGCFINEHGELIEVTVSVEVVGTEPQGDDLIGVSVESKVFDIDGNITTPPIDILEIILSASRPFGSTFSNASIFLDFDIDQNPSTGGLGFINSGEFPVSFPVPSTGLGVEIAWSCTLNVEIEQCTAINNGFRNMTASFFLDPNSGQRDFSRIVFRVPRRNDDGVLGVGDSANLAIAALSAGFVEELATLHLDVVPNGDSNPPFIDSSIDIFQAVPDPLGDPFTGILDEIPQ